MSEPAKNQLLEEALAILRAGLEAVSPDRLLADEEIRRRLRSQADSADRVFVVGAGKASMAMASSIEEILGDWISNGLIIVPHGYPDHLPDRFDPPKRVAITTAGHPVPDQFGMDAAGRILEMAAETDENDLLIVLISGGASALLPAFARGISLEDAAKLTRLLLASGAEIHEINTVRKHVSRIGGGRLAGSAKARVETLIISDVVGNDPAFIGSGPCTADPTTYGDAVEVLERYDLMAKIPDSVHSHLESGRLGQKPETVKSGALDEERVNVEVLGTNETAVDAMAAKASDKGWTVVSAGYGITGEARDVGAEMAEKAMDLPDRHCLVWGGETTVTLRGEGTGGRNQELILGAARELSRSRRKILLLSAGTDGVDGASDAAGGWADEETLSRAESSGHSVEDALRENDSATLLRRLDQQIITGPTHTNVMDVGLALIV